MQAIKNSGISVKTYQDALTSAKAQLGIVDPEPTPDTTAPVLLQSMVNLVTKNSANVSLTTNEDTTAIIEYGTTNAYGQSAQVTTTKIGNETAHNASLTGLQSNTPYFVKATVSDAAGNATVKELAFTTLADAGEQDVTPPTFTTVNASNSGSTSMFVGWNTDEAAVCTIEYGTTSAYGQTGTVQAFGNMYMSDITGLQANTNYFFKITATDAAGNTSTHEGQHFTAHSGQPGDVNGDGPVDEYDLSILLYNWNKSGMSLTDGNLVDDEETTGYVDELDLSNFITGVENKL
jgi:hypothetical protein